MLRLLIEIGRLADPCLATDLRDGRSFLALLHAKRFLGVRELRCSPAKPPRPAKENYGKKLYFQMVQVSGSRAKATFGLTKTECRILGDVLDGKSPSDTAEDSGTSIFTVRTHIRNIYRKLNVKNRASLLRRVKRYT